jgi:hypothetical protein
MSANFKSSEQTHAEWEDEVTRQIEQTQCVCRSDAQAIVEGQPFTMAQSWGLGLDPEKAADRVLKAASPSPAHDRPSGY